ncbi:98_t:CDS:2 [Diversispora eburnea]|uniref:98_t:CDS:1 n=1 Tax=Diversispora eburnea TaxID=1213867 RepID=A0A9N8VGW8_9GLOM|nr:98_t:CDS:2 [Diversispora eburnea]
MKIPVANFAADYEPPVIPPVILPVISPVISPVRNGRETLKSFERFEDDFKWVTRNHFEEHGILSQQVTSGAFKIKKENANMFSETYFSFIKNRESREILIESFKRLFYTEGHVFTHSYIDLTYGKENIDEITGGIFFMYAEGSIEKRTVLISLTRLSKQSVLGYYFLKDYYKGNEDRVENALNAFSSLSEDGKYRLIRFGRFEDDLKWITHSHCATHGSSCGSHIEYLVTSSTFTMEQENVDKFCETYFNFITHQESRDVVTSSLKALFYTEEQLSTHKYIEITHGMSNVDKPIKGGFYFIDSKGGSGRKRNEERVENALKYIVFRDNDLKWITHTHCETGESSCGGSLTQKVTSGILIIEKQNADLFNINYGKENTDKPITGEFYFMHSKGTGEKRTSPARLSKKLPGHYFLKGYYEGTSDDLKWVTHSHCATYGSSCGDHIEHLVTSSTFTIEQENVDKYIEITYGMSNIDKTIKGGFYFIDVKDGSGRERFLSQ